MAPGTKFLKQQNELDFALGKSFRRANGQQLRLRLDIFNALNSSWVETQNTTMRTAARSADQHHAGAAVSRDGAVSLLKLVSGWWLSVCNDKPPTTHHQPSTEEVRVLRSLIVIAMLLVVPVASFAQDATLTGTVKDTSGGVLPV